MLEYFFKDLGARITDENDLSDVTWAFVKNCEEFRAAFMEFFEFQFNPRDPFNIDREKILSNKSRPDIFLECGERKFIIEVKLADKNYHIPEYSSSREGQSASGFGIILNHQMDNESLQDARNLGIKVRTWEAFLNYLKGKAKNETFSPEVNSTLSAYSSYLRAMKLAAFSTAVAGGSSISKGARS
jgi:hypothetical protein